MRKLIVMLTPFVSLNSSAIGGFEFADGTERMRWRTHAAAINRKAANDETANAWRATA